MSSTKPEASVAAEPERRSTEVGAALVGERVDRALSLLSGLSRSQVQKLVEAGEVLVDGVAETQASRRLNAGETLGWPVTDAGGSSSLEPDDAVTFGVLHEDDHLVVIDKPAGVVVHPGAGNATGTLVHGLLARFPEMATVGEAHRPGIVHRLDKDTSGLLVVARSAEAHGALVDAMAKRRITRRYRTIVWGHFATPRGVVDAPIGRSNRDRTRMAVAEDGRPARTHYRVEHSVEDPAALSLLACRLETGRTHQIRVHLAAIDHPVVGDARYGGDRHSLRVPRTMLHAAEIELRHPVSGADMAFEAAVPTDMSTVVAQVFAT